MKKRLLSILLALVVLTSLVNANIRVQAATHTHEFEFTGMDQTKEQCDDTYHYIKATLYYACYCGAIETDIQRMKEAHNKTLTNYHHGTQHTFGESCDCGWKNITTYPCPGGNGGICITPYFGMMIE